MCAFDTILVILKRKNLKQKDLTDYLGLTKNTFTNWKGGRSESWKKYLPQIAEFLGVSVDELLGAPRTVAFDPTLDELYSLILSLDAADRLTLRRMALALAADEKYKKSAPASDA